MKLSVRIATLFTAGLMAVSAAPALGTPSPETSSPAPSGNTSGLSWQTLVTGDRVAYRRAGTSVEILGMRPAASSSGMFRTVDLGARTRVVPAEAQPYVDAGVIDAALFDIRALTRTDSPQIVVHEKDGDERSTAIPADQEAARSLWDSLVTGEPGLYGTDDQPRLAPDVEAIRLHGTTPKDMQTSAAQSTHGPASPCEIRDDPREPGPGKVPVTIKALDRRGQPSSAHFLLRAYHCRPWEGYGFISFSTGPDGRTFYLPPSSYSLMGDITTLDASGRFPMEVTIGGDTQLDITEGRDIVVDARDAVPLAADTPRESETALAVLGWTRGADDHRLLSSLVLTPQYSSIERMSVIPAESITDGEFDFYPTFRQTAPLAQADVPGLGALHPKLLPWGLPATFSEHLRLTDDPTRCQGCAVLVHEDPAAGIAGPVQQAVAGGAEAVLVMPAEPGRVHGSAGSAGVPVLALPYVEGVALDEQLRHGRVMVDIEVTPYPPYLYDLAMHETDELPADLVYEIEQDDVRRIEQRFHGDGTGGLMFETRFPTSPCLCSLVPIFGFAPTGTTRVDYVSDDASVWQQELFRPGLQLRDAGLPFSDEAPGVVDWMAGPLVPGLPRGLPVGHYRFPALTKDGSLVLRVPALVDNDGHGGTLGTTSGRLLRNGDIVEELTYAGYVTVPAGDDAATWRLEMEHSHSPQQWSTATSGSVAWTFRAGGESSPDPAPLPLIGARIELPLTLQGTTEPHRRMLTIEPWRLDGQPVEVADIDLALSTDGGSTWHPQRPLRTRDGFKLLPRLDGHGPVSLRLRIEDRGGSSLERTIHHAWTR